MTYWDQFQTIGEPKEFAVEPQQPIQESTQPIQSQSAIQQPAQNDFWDQYKTVEPKEPEETRVESFQRQAKGAITRGLGQVAGFPGDIESLGRSLIPGVSKENVLPTSEKIMEKRKELHPELEPRGKREELQQEIIGDYLLQPGGPGKKLAISAAQTFAKELAKDLGGGEKVQAGTKIITGILASRSGKPNVKDFIKKEYEEASKAIPKNATISGSRAESYLSQVKEKVNQGGHAAWKNDVNAQINALEKSIHSGKIKVTALDQSIKDINSQLMEKGVRGSQAEMWLTRIKQAAQHELKQYGKSNPEFLKHYKDANASFAGYKQSLIGQKQIEKFKEAGLFKGTVGLLAHGIANPEASMQALGSLAALYGIKKSGELTQRIFSSPVLASHYMKAIASAAKENAPQTIANLSKLDQELRKSNQNFPNKQSK